MSNLLDRPFDCVRQMREARDQISAQIGTMSHEELVRWVRSHRYSDPLLQRLADTATQHPHPADAVIRRR